MATGTANFRYFILGLLAQRSMSGYDISRFLKSLGWLLGNPSFGTIYPTLHALLEDDLATVQVVSRLDRPPRKIYTITEAGRQALGEWVAQPASSSAKLKTFAMHLITVGDFSRVGLVSHLKQRWETVDAHLSALERMIQELGERTNTGQRLALEYGLAMANAELAWLDSRLVELSAGSNVDHPGTKT
jgi:DNA-binding PadR family transcriptional regulator